MEEKERYKLESYNEAFCQIHDTKSDEWYLRKDLVKDLLNQQDKKIKDLETKLAEKETDIIALDTENYSFKQQIDSLRQQLAESENKLKGFVELFDKKQHENYEQFCEIMQLKQQLKDTEESYNNTMRYLNKTRSELLNLPKKIVEEIRDVLNGNDIEIQDNIYLTDILDAILKKYGGEDE